MKKAIRIFAVLLLVAALVVSANAAEFTPSVEQKGAPTVSVSDTGKKVELTPVSESDEASAEAKALLEEAYKSVEAAKSLADVAPELTEVLAKLDSTADVADLVVRDLVHVSVEQGEDETTVLTFDLDLDKDDVLVVMMYVDGKWVAIDPELVTINANGTVSVQFTGKVGVLAFATLKTE